MTASIDDLRALGYTVGVAHGDAQAERDRLADLEATCTPEALTAAASDIGRSAADVCRQRGMANADLIAAVADVVQEAHDQLAGHAERALAHQRRTIAVADAMPTVYRVEGFGISPMVAADDQETLDALADPASHEERVAQHEAAG